MQEMQRSINRWWNESDSINILITGRSGNGKSSLVNVILGEDAAAVGKSMKCDPETSKVSSYMKDIEGIKVIAWDSPGLQHKAVNKDDTYLDDIEMQCRDKIDLFIYCISMIESRFMEGGDDNKSMCKLTGALGKGIWKNSVIVLTCANEYIIKEKAKLRGDQNDDDVIIKFNNKLRMWQSEVKKMMHEKLKLPREIVENMPIIPAGTEDKPFLLEGYSKSPWLSELWMESLLVAKSCAQPALIKMNHKRLVCGSGIHIV